MKKHFKQLGKDTAIYGIGGALTRGLALLLLPFYTRIFSPEEFGIIELVAIFSLFLKVFMNMGLDSALSFFFFQQKTEGKEKQAQLISSIFQFRILLGIIFLLGIAYLAPWLNSHFFENKLSNTLFMIAIGETFFLLISEQTAGIFRLTFQPTQYFIVNLSRTLFSAIFILFFCYILKLSIIGYFLGLTLGSIVACLIGFIKTWEFLRLKKIHHQLWSKLTKFSFPLIGSSLALYFLNTADRWFINYYSGSEQLGLYAVALKFVSVITLFSNTFRLAWQPISFDLLNNAKSKIIFRSVARLFLGGGIVIAIMMTAFSKLILQIFTTEEYLDGYQIIGVLSWSYIMTGFNPIISMGIWKKKKTYLFTITALIAALVNMGLNYMLVPKYGIMGAAFSSALAFSFWSFITIIISEKLWPVNFNYFIFGIQFTIGLVSCALIQRAIYYKESYWVIILTTLVSIIVIASISLSLRGINELKARIRNKP